MHTTQLIAQTVRSKVAEKLRQYAPVRKGLVSAVGTGPARVTVKGKPMPYVESYSTPAVGDLVAYSAGPDPICLGRIAD